MRKGTFGIACLLTGISIAGKSYSCRTLPPGSETPGPPGPTVPLDCGSEEETLTKPDRKRHRLTEPDCIDRYVERLDRALAADPAIDSYRIRSGRIEDIPPSSQWQVGLNPRFPDAPTFVIAVPFEEPLRWKPYVVTWFSTLENTPPRGQSTTSLEISKENLRPEGMELHLSALNGSEVLEVSVEWVAYDTTTITR